MALIDALLSFVPYTSPLSLVLGAGVSQRSPGIIDLMGDGVGTPVRNIVGIATVPGSADAAGVGNERPDMVIAVGAAFATGNSATLNVQFQGAPDNGSNQPGTWVSYWESGAIAAASLTAGRILARLPWPPPFLQNARPRFLSLNFSIPAATNFTTGTIAYALVTSTRDDNYQMQMPRNFRVAGAY
jgi:hypothetical protein